MKVLPTERQTPREPGALGMRHQHTLGDDEVEVLRPTTGSEHGWAARLLSFRYGTLFGRYQLSRSAEAGGDILQSSRGDVVVTVPASDAVRLLGTTTPSLENLGGLIAVVGVHGSSRREEAITEVDDELLSFRFRELDEADQHWDVEAIKGAYYGYRTDPEALGVLQDLRDRVEADAQSFVQLINGLLLRTGPTRLTVFVPDHTPMRRDVGLAIAPLVHVLHQDAVDYRLRKRGFQRVGDWGFFDGNGSSPHVTCSLFTREA
jgi:hypothetical protein